MLHTVINLVDCPDEFVFLTIKMNRIEAQQVDERGNLPLHVLCATQASALNVSTLISMHPKAVTTVDRCGRLPFEVAHCAANSYANHHHYNRSNNKASGGTSSLGSRLGYCGGVGGVWNDMLQVLLEANPHALEQSFGMSSTCISMQDEIIMDVLCNTSMMLAVKRCGNSVDRRRRLNTVFEIIRNRPSLVRNVCTVR